MTISTQNLHSHTFLDVEHNKTTRKRVWGEKIDVFAKSIFPHIFSFELNLISKIEKSNTQYTTTRTNLDHKNWVEFYLRYDHLCKISASDYHYIDQETHFFDAVMLFFRLLIFQGKFFHKKTCVIHDIHDCFVIVEVFDCF
jgi:hypothetical protein